MRYCCYLVNVMWSETGSAEGATGSSFGFSVGVSNQTVIVGSTGDSTSRRAYILDDGDNIFANGFE